MCLSFLSLPFLSSRILLLPMTYNTPMILLLSYSLLLGIVLLKGILSECYLSHSPLLLSYPLSLPLAYPPILSYPPACYPLSYPIPLLSSIRSSHQNFLGTCSLLSLSCLFSSPCRVRVPRFLLLSIN